MGKNGAAMRAAKMQNTRYSFTKEQLMIHDRGVIEEFKKRVLQDVYSQADAYYTQREKDVMQTAVSEWERRELAFAENHPIDNVISCMSLLMATTARVLVERFRWKPLPKDGEYDGRNRLAQFCEAVQDEINRITADPEKADIIGYCDETYDLYGVRFNAVEK